VILGLRDGLRSGDVYVPGSRRYADPATYLYTPAQWKPRQADYCRLVGKPARARRRPGAGKEELRIALAEMENTLAAALPDDTGTVRLDADDHLVIPKLTAEDIPAEARELKEELSGMLPFAPIASLLIELDGRTGFLDCFTHAGGRRLAHSPELKRNILAVLIAMATNVGPARMSEACGISYDVRPGRWSGTYARRRCARLTPASSTTTTGWSCPRCSAAAPCPPPTGSASPCPASR